MRAHVRTLLSRSDGATAAEYAIVVTLIAVVIIGAVLLFGGAVNDLYVNANNQIK